MHLGLPPSFSRVLEAISSPSLPFPFLFTNTPTLFTIFCSLRHCVQHKGTLGLPLRLHMCLHAPCALGGPMCYFLVRVKTPIRWPFFPLSHPLLPFSVPCHPFGRRLAIVASPHLVPPSSSPLLPLFLFFFLSYRGTPSLSRFFSFWQNNDCLHVESLIRHVDS